MMAAKHCAHHPRYTGSSLPRATDCPICWGIFLQEKYGIDSVDVLCPHVMNLNNRADIEGLIAALKFALSRSAANGGAYSAFAHTKEGDTFQIEIQLGVRP